MNILFRKKTPFFLMLLLLLVGAGYIATKLSVQLYPQVGQPIFYFSVRHTGYSAQDFYNDWAEDIEDKITILSDLLKYEGTYSQDRTSYKITFDWDTDTFDAESSVNDLVNQVESEVPDDFNVHSYFSDGGNAGYLSATITSLEADPRIVYNDLQQVLYPELVQRLDDAEVIELSPIEELGVNITLDYESMLKNKINIDSVQSVFSDGYLPTPIGSIDGENESYSLRLRGNIDNLAELGELPIRYEEDHELKLKNIATLEWGYNPPRRILSTNGVRSLSLYIEPKKDGNIRSLALETKAIFEELKEEGRLPASYEYRAIVDPAQFINESVLNILVSALIGGSLAALIVLLTLGQWRNTILVIISLPCSILLSFWLMYSTGISINLISLGGIALAVGMVVDAAVVVIENIDRHLSESQDYESSLYGRSKQYIIIYATKEVSLSVIISTVTSILVFLPLAFTAPLSAAILGEQALTVIFTLILSVFISLLFIPLFSHSLSKVSSQTESRLHKLTHWVNFLQALYLSSLERLLRSKLNTTLYISGVTAIVIVASLFIVPQIEQELLPAPNGDLLYVYQENGESDQEVILTDYVPALEEIIDPLIEPYLLRTQEYPEGNHFNQISENSLSSFYQLADSRKSDEVREILEKVLVDDGDISYSIASYDPAKLPLPTLYDWQVNLAIDTDEKGINALQQIKYKLSQEDSVVRTYTKPYNSEYNQELLFEGRESQLLGLGVSDTNMRNIIQRSLLGTSSLDFDLENETLEIEAEYPDELFDSLAKIEDFLLVVDDKFVPVKHLFNLERSSSVDSLYTTDGEKVFRLFANFKSFFDAKEKMKIANELKTTINASMDSSQFSYPDPNPDLTEAINSLLLALLISILLIYLLLTFQFGNLKEPLIVLLTIPSALTGVIISLWLFDSSFSLNSLLGAILLCGVAVNNAIIIIDFYRQRVKQLKNSSVAEQLESYSEEKLELLLECAKLRFKPILITTLTTILGMLPLALGLGQASNIVQPLGIAVSGGLFLSTFLSLYLVPIATLHLGNHR